MTRTLITSVATAIILSMILFGAYLLSPVYQASGSVNIANEYHATTTNALSGQNLFLCSIPGEKSSGSLGSVIVTTAGTAGGALEFYDATTTDATKRAASMSTTSIRLFSIPNNAAAGTYTIDASFKNGLIMFNDRIANAGTTTVTCR